MLDVFERLHRHSISSKTGRAAVVVESAKRMEEEKWKKMLIAACRIVTQDPAEFSHERASVPCLSISSLKRKRRPQSAVVKKVSTVMSSDGSVSSTQYYLVTDSVEPPPYRVARVQPPGRLKSARQKKPEGLIATSGMRKEIRNFKRRTVSYGALHRVVEEKMLEVETDDEQDSHEEPRVIQVDFNNPLSMDRKIEPMQMISHTGQHWENNGYPSSVSYILE